MHATTYVNYDSSFSDVEEMYNVIQAQWVCDTVSAIPNSKSERRRIVILTFNCLYKNKMTWQQKIQTRDVCILIAWVFIYRCPRRKGQYSGRSQYRSFYENKSIWTCFLFRAVSEIELFECTVAKLLIRKWYYILFLIFIVLETNLLVNNKFSKIPPSTSMHFATRVRTWRVARLSSCWRSFMRAIAAIMRSSSSSHVSTFLLYTYPNP
jgi:hypothetical protein